MYSKGLLYSSASSFARCVGHGSTCSSKINAVVHCISIQKQTTALIFYEMRSLFSLLSHLTALPCITGIDDDIHVGAVHQVFQDAKLLFGTSRHQIFIIYLFVLRSTAI